jgi:hypothetical protein
METQTRFDLATAIGNWRQQLTAQSGLTAEDCRELETHLRDSLADLQHLGLGDEEAFWLVCRRVGPPQQLSKEFLAADPTKVWRERAFWFAMALLATQLLGLAGQALLAVGLRCTPDWVAIYAPAWWWAVWRPRYFPGILHILASWVFPFLVLAITIKRGHLGTGSPLLRFVTSSRSRLVLLSTALVLLLNWLYYLPLSRTQGFIPFLSADSVLRYLGLVAVVAWLMPKQVGVSHKEAVAD